jgi:hypothetical protein
VWRAKAALFVCFVKHNGLDGLGSGRPIAMRAGAFGGAEDIGLATKVCHQS